MHLQSPAKIQQLFQRQGKQFHFENWFNSGSSMMQSNFISFQFQKDPNRKLGQLDAPSQYDIEKIRKMYNCKKW